MYGLFSRNLLNVFFFLFGTGLFQEVTLDSREFLKDILPILTTQYRSKDASNRFTFTRAQLVHNEELTKSFIEWRKDMKDEGRTDKELTESFAFISTDSEKEAQKMCQEGLSANGSHSAVLGNPSMGKSDFVVSFLAIILATILYKGIWVCVVSCLAFQLEGASAWECEFGIILGEFSFRT